MEELHPDVVLKAYALGLFPMAETRHDPRVLWIDPQYRGILPLKGFHVPRSVRKVQRQHAWQIRFDTDFRSVIRACADSTPQRPDSWINNTILDVFTELHEQGYAHSVEVWDGDDLVGGLYGVALQSVFFGESMFSRRSNASKIALIALVERLVSKRFMLLDTQFVNDYIKQFGAVEVPRRVFRRMLGEALAVPAVF